MPDAVARLHAALDGQLVWSSRRKANMGRLRCRLFLLLATLLMGCSEGGVNEALRDELSARAVTDQVIRDTLVQILQRGEVPDSSLRLRMLAVDSANTNWLKQVIAENGWPGRSLVGQEGAHTAYLIAQHAVHDAAFQAEVLLLLEAAYRAGEAGGGEVAYLTDRVAVQAGRPQRYGSQFQIRATGVVFNPIEDSVNVDERRAALGLPPLAEYARQSNLVFAPQQPWMVLLLVTVPAVGSLVVLLGVIGLLVPSALIRFVERAWSSSTGFLTSIAVRAALGIVLLLVASNTRFPWAIGALGIISLAAAVAMPVIGHARMREFVHQWTKWPPWSVRLSLLLAIGFGAFLVYTSALAASIAVERFLG